MNVREFVIRFGKLKDRYRKHAFFAIALLLLLLFFGKSIKAVLVVTAFIIIASFSTFYHNYFRSPINFELVKLFTVIGSVAYGIGAGLVIGIFSVLIGRALSGRLDQDTLTSIAAISAIAVLAGIFSSVNIATLGILLVIVYYIIILPFILLFGENLGFESIYIFTNILFNSFMFIKLAPFIVSFIN